MSIPNPHAGYITIKTEQSSTSTVNNNDLLEGIQESRVRKYVDEVSEITPKQFNKLELQQVHNKQFIEVNLKEAKQEEQTSTPTVTNEDLVQSFRYFMTMNTTITADLDSVLVAADRIIENTNLGLKDVFSGCFLVVHGEKNKSFQTVSLPEKAKSIFYAKYFKDLYNNIRSLKGSMYKNTLNLIKSTNTLYTYRKGRHYLECVNFIKQALAYVIGTLRLIELKSNLVTIVLSDNTPNKKYLSALFEELLQPYKINADKTETTEQEQTSAPSLIKNFYFSMSIEVPSNVDFKECCDIIQKNIDLFKKQQQQLIQNLLFLNK